MVLYRPPMGFRCINLQQIVLSNQILNEFCLLVTFLNFLFLLWSWLLLLMAALTCALALWVFFPVSPFPLVLLGAWLACKVFVMFFFPFYHLIKSAAKFLPSFLKTHTMISAKWRNGVPMKFLWETSKNAFQLPSIYRGGWLLQDLHAALL